MQHNCKPIPLCSSCMKHSLKPNVYWLNSFCPVVSIMMRDILMMRQSGKPSAFLCLKKDWCLFLSSFASQQTWKINFLQVCKYSNSSNGPRDIKKYYTPGYGNWKIGMLMDYQNRLFPLTHFRNVPKTFSCIQTPSSFKVLEK